MFTRAGQPRSLSCGVVCGGAVQEGTMPLAWLWAGFQSLPHLPTSKLGPSGADSWVSGFVYVLGPCGSLHRTLLWGWEFLPLPQPSQVFSVRGFEALFPCTGTLGCVVCHAPQSFLPVYPQVNVGLPASTATALPHVLCTPAACLCTSYQSGWLINSLVFGLPYSLIFWQCWLFFVFKFVVLLLVMWGGKVYLPVPPS